jgi:thymidine kinase
MTTMFNIAFGHLEVICGPMFSGKTEELIRRIRRSQIARQKIQIFKPTIDTRYSTASVVSHSAQSVSSVAVSDPKDILQLVKDHTRVVAIDEVQFFDDAIIDVVEKLTNRGLRVICAGLDLDYLAKPFGPMGELLAMADTVTKIQAVCTVCGGPATRTQRIVNSKEQVLLGELEAYEARCRMHYDAEDFTDNKSGDGHEQLDLLSPPNH